MDTAAANVIRSRAEDFRKLGATGVFLFGSRAREDFTPDSDVDLFIEYDRARKVPNFFDLIQFEQRLARIVGHPVSITTRYALHPLLRDDIERDAIKLI